MHNRNSQTVQEMRDVSRNQDAVEALPSSFSPNIQLVAEVNPKMMRRTEKIYTVSSATTLPSDKDFFITKVEICSVKDAAKTGSDYILAAVQNGETMSLARLFDITSVATAPFIVVDFNYPFRCDRGSNLTLSVTGTTSTTRALVHGYYT